MRPACLAIHSARDPERQRLQGGRRLPGLLRAELPRRVPALRLAWGVRPSLENPQRALSALRRA
eukprot:10314282-Alexandrium_andersonii.AAC.1